MMDGRTTGVDLLGDAPDWQERALCAQTDPESFFPEKGGSTRDAKRICNRCEVRAECLEYALDKDERFGVWGGLSERERRRLKRRLNSTGPSISPAALQVVRALASQGAKVATIAAELGCSPSWADEQMRANGIRRAQRPSSAGTPASEQVGAAT